MKRTFWTLILALLAALLFAGAAAGESVEPAASLYAYTEEKIQRIESGPVYVTQPGYYGTGTSIVATQSRKANSAEVVWLEGEEQLSDIFEIEKIGDSYYMGFSGSITATGTATFRLTVTSDEGTAERDFTVTVTEPDMTKAPSLAMSEVNVAVNSPVNMSTMNVLNNPGGFDEDFYISANNRSYYYHNSEDAEGMRFTIGHVQDVRTFTAHEAGAYSAVAVADFGLNMEQRFPFTIVAEAAGEETGAALYAYTEEKIQRIESGPVYVTQPGYYGTGNSIVATQSGAANSAEVVWLEGEEQLRDIFEIEKIGNSYYMGFASNITATGTATFRLMVTSDEGTAERDFTVTVTEPDMTKVPSLAVSEVSVAVNRPVNMSTMNVLNNPGGFEEDFYISANNMTYFYHDSEDAEGLRFTIGHVRDVRTFTAHEAGAYSAVAIAEFGLNMEQRFPFTIVAEDIGENPEISLNYSSSFLNSLRRIEEGPTYLPFSNFRGDTYVYTISLENDETIDFANVEWVSGSEALTNMFTTRQSSSGGRWLLAYNEDYGGTGTATFRVTAASGDKAAQADFTVTVEELEGSAVPVQQKTSVEIPLGVQTALSDLGIVSNPGGYDETYMVRGAQSSSSRHDYQDADGDRFTLNNGSFLGQEIMMYNAFVQIKPSYNLTASFNFTISVVNAAVNEEEVTLTPSGIGSVRTLACDGAASWTSSNASAATVENGKVTAQGLGTATIRALDANGAALVQYNVSVREMDTFTLPTRITELSAEALAGTAAERVILPDGVTAIAPDAFANMPNLQVLYIPSGALISGLQVNGDTVVYTDAAVSGLEYAIEVQ